ncbi:MurR/RpiR family transcriptional regulator [Bacillus horti]|uniref:DNA-binding MurR/RpiR family transcriptional regulator n=1 Tax=Caldalkalibacillus horti TaxID=77523 RepID=A0ABT9W0P4_9BACI|nr:MurR/RpiR family transcriptional regulator [Bacillus horti]MDQ0166828.1 DNA-binding MurR/RpiR family transcriptional regulator [Bacillus horti]
MDQLKEKVLNQYDNLSKGLKKVAKHFLNHPATFAMYSAAQVGKEINVGETTVIRFCHALGYHRFSDFQKEVKDKLLNNQSSLNEYHSEKKGLDHNINLVKQIMFKDAEVIQSTAEKMNIEDYQRAIDHLEKSKRILVSGMRSSYAMAHWFAFVLEIFRGDVRLFRPDMDDIILRLHELNSESTLVAFSFHRYAIETVNIAKEAKNQGAFVIGISDSMVSPIREYVDVLFTVPLPKPSTLDVGPAVFSLINALVAGVYMKNPSQFEKRMELYDKVKINHFFAE